MPDAPFGVLLRALSSPEQAPQGFRLPDGCLVELLSFLRSCPAMLPGLLQLLLRGGGLILRFSQALLQPGFLLLQVLMVTP